MDIEEIHWKIEDEGLGYFIEDYASEEDMPTPELKAAFRQARAALDNFRDILGDPEE